MKNWNLVIGICFVIGILSLGFWVAGCASSKKDEHKKHVLFYRNPMNPQITSPVPQKDEMGMDYIPVYEEETKTDGRVKISPEKQQLIGVKTETAKRVRLTKKIRTAGKIAYDPDLYTAQTEFLQALSSNSADLISAAKTRLRLLGMSADQIERLSRKGKPTKIFCSPGKRSGCTPAHTNMKCLLSESDSP